MFTFLDLELHKQQCIEEEDLQKEIEEKILQMLNQQQTEQNELLKQ